MIHHPDQISLLLAVEAPIQAEVAAAESWQTLRGKALDATPDRAMSLIDAAVLMASHTGDVEGQIKCIFSRSHLLMNAGQPMEAFFALTEAERLLTPQTPLHVRIEAKVRLAALYRDVLGNLPEAIKLLRHARVLSEGAPIAPFVRAHTLYLLSNRAADGLQWTEAMQLIHSSSELLQCSRPHTPDGKLRSYEGQPLGFWRAICKVQPVWLMVAEQVALGKDSNSLDSLSIDTGWWNLLNDPDVQAYRRDPAVAFLVEYVGTWLGYVMFEHAKPESDWQQALFWRALRLPPGNLQSVPRPTLAVPNAVQDIPLVKALVAFGGTGVGGAA